jgi:hypothetical protein
MFFPLTNHLLPLSLSKASTVHSSSVLLAHSVETTSAEGHCQKWRASNCLSFWGTWLFHVLLPLLFAFSGHLCQLCCSNWHDSLHGGMFMPCSVKSSKFLKWELTSHSKDLGCIWVCLKIQATPKLDGDSESSFPYKITHLKI